MRNRLRMLLSLCLCCCLALGVCTPVLAADEKPDLILKTPEEFLDFVTGCRLDSYSRDLTVRLDADLDLSDLDFDGIPIFSGTFDGNNHKITGISLKKDGSNQGFFRYLTDTARVENLTLSGTVCPAGSSKSVGGIVGSNAGTIVNCFFDGTVSGIAQVGGIAGENFVSGVIEDCAATGSVTGDHFVGGIAGSNDGLIRSCTNRSKICTEVRDEAVDLSNVSIDTVTDSESVAAVTDLGGIAGTNNGFIRGCSNNEAVGYPHVGYNVGGIAGSQKGSMEDCRNHASISGRKEVGGIVGQLEPVSQIEYEEDALQQLGQQLSQTIDLADQASANASGNAYAITSQIDALRSYSQSAKEAAGQMIIQPGKPLPDLDQLQAASSSLTSSLTGMKDSTISLGHSTQAALSGITGDIQALVEQLKVIRSTIDQAPDSLGGTLVDVSDQDTEEEFSAEISGCQNDSDVLGDLNIGGITGSIARENDLDPEDDFQFTGDISLNFSGELRAVIRDCSNQGSISGKKRNAGGIVGSMRFGLVHSCTNAGAVEADGAEYVGGIVGQGTGFLRSCSAKCRLTARRWVGGIAGSAPVVTDCRSMVAIDKATEKSGAILGQLPQLRLNDETEIRSNVYLPVFSDLGGIDGISYEDTAVPLTEEDFFALPKLSSIFSQAQVTFLFEDGESKTVAVPTGGALDPKEIPAVPEEDQATLEWEGLAEEDISHIYFDRVYHLSATPCQTTVQSSALREDGKPVMLIEGLFADSSPFSSEPIEDQPSLEDGRTFLEAWSLPGLASTSRIRISVPDGSDAKLIRVYLRSGDTWREAEVSVHGSYLALDASAEDDALCLAAAPAPFPWGICLGGILIGAACITLVTVLLIRRHRKKAQSV